MSRDWQLFIDDMIDACRNVISFTRDEEPGVLDSDPHTRSALVRELFVLIEAAQHVPDEVRAQVPAIPWRKMTGLRDILAHDTFDLDSAILWDVAIHHVPQVLDELLRLQARP